MTQLFVTSGVKEQHSYVVANTKHVMEILSNHLYSNKVNSVIRELLTNAYDSHIISGQKLSVKIILPTQQNLTFSVRDYGTGLSHDDVVNMYRMYGVSNKDGSNKDVIGYMGIGSKSPFAYTDSFTTISYYNGVKRVYINAKNDERLPTINLIHTSETNEPNGLEISFAVKSKDINSFIENTKKILEFFDDSFCPNDIPKIDKTIIMSGNGWEWSKSERGNKLMIVVGTISYEVNIYHDIDELRDILQTPSCNCFYIFCNPGDVSISASRESIQYDKKTINFLKKRLPEVYKDVHNCIQKEINSAHSFYQAHKKFHRVFDNISTFTYNNRQLTQYIDISPFKDDVKGTNKRRKSYFYYSCNIYVNDCVGGYSRAKAQGYDDNILITPKIKEEFCKYVGAIEADLIYTSSLPPVKHDRISSSSSTTYDAYYYDTAHRDSWKPMKLDAKIQKDTFFVPIYRMDVVCDNKHTAYGSYCLSDLIEFNKQVFGESINEVIGIPVRYLKKIEKNKHFINLIDRVKGNIRTHISNHIYVIENLVYYDIIGRDTQRFFEKYIDDIKDSKIKKFYNEINQCKIKKFNGEHARNSMVRYIIDKSCNTMIKKISTKWKGFSEYIDEKYPLLTHYSLYNNKKETSQFVDYVNCMYKYNKEKVNA